MQPNGSGTCPGHMHEKKAVSKGQNAPIGSFAPDCTCCQCSGRRSQRSPTTSIAKSWALPGPSLPCSSLPSARWPSSPPLWRSKRTLRTIVVVAPETCPCSSMKTRNVPLVAVCSKFGDLMPCHPNGSNALQALRSCCKGDPTLLQGLLLVRLSAPTSFFPSGPKTKMQSCTRTLPLDWVMSNGGFSLRARTKEA